MRQNVSSETQTSLPGYRLVIVKLHCANFSSIGPIKGKPGPPRRSGSREFTTPLIPLIVVFDIFGNSLLGRNGKRGHFPRFSPGYGPG